MYAPRVTYWPDGMVLKVEFSVPKMLGDVLNPTEEDKERALTLVDAYLEREGFGDLPSVRRWVCQRVDYAWMWDVGEHLPAYLDMLSRLNVSGMNKQAFKGEGVVWKAVSRWIKFYDKSKEQQSSGGWLRFEVSNYAASVRYMCDAWFGCERVVSEVVRVDRAVDVLTRMWRKLGLDGEQYRSELTLLADLRRVYGSSVASAFYVLHCMNTFGSVSVKRGLLSSSTYHTWKRRLIDDGFVMIVGDDEHEIAPRSLPVLKLPSQNLDDLYRAPLPLSSKISRQNWEMRQ